jgi:hypothetical protein
VAGIAEAGVATAGIAVIATLKVIIRRMVGQPTAVTHAVVGSVGDGSTCFIACMGFTAHCSNGDGRSQSERAASPPYGTV